MLYTRSLQACPLSEKENYAIILANRSANFDSSRQWAACERDIRMALQCGYPKNLQYKVGV